jgi:hypothetical protein
MNQGSGIGDQGSGAPRKKRRWILYVLGVLVLLFFVAVGAIIFTVSYFRQNVQVMEDVTEGTAKNEFDTALAKFPGQQPLLQMVDGQPQLVSQKSARTTAGQPVTTLHVLAFDSDDDDMVRLSLPFWLLRMQSKPIRLSSYSKGWDDRDVSFKVQDIEAAGPGIVADFNREREGRVLIWVE